uniref:Uncharacterized protein n=1 Tax=Meloidogyne enterolobii TaxID=390850 RepID=A0A6V7XAK1_MELEN|nr:unnamed protein product [Meloidogyne enterolobii]
MKINGQPHAFKYIFVFVFKIKTQGMFIFLVLFWVNQNIIIYFRYKQKYQLI